MVVEQSPQPLDRHRRTKARAKTGVPWLERSRIFEVPLISTSCFFHTAVLLMPSDTNRFMAVSMLQNCCAVMATRAETRSGILHVIVCDTR
jgi:hypothetical protein